MADLPAIPNLTPIQEAFKATSGRLNALIETCIIEAPPNDIPIYLQAAPPLLSELFQHKTAALVIKNALDAASSVAEDKMTVVNQHWSTLGNAINPHDHTKFLLRQKWTSKVYKELAIVNTLLAEIESLMHTTCTIARDCHTRNANESQTHTGSSS